MTAYGPDDFRRDLGGDVSRETIERLETHHRLLAEWSERMNLIGPRELELFWSRHALDSAQLLRLAPGARRWVDLGSGAGFPGLVLAAFLAGQEGACVHLVEATGKKARFLQAVVDAAALPANVFNCRIEAFRAGEGPYDVVTARALAPSAKSRRSSGIRRPWRSAWWTKSGCRPSMETTTSGPRARGTPVSGAAARTAAPPAKRARRRRGRGEPSFNHLKGRREARQARVGVMTAARRGETRT